MGIFIHLGHNILLKFGALNIICINNRIQEYDGGERLKKFFSYEDRFNIFSVIGLILIIAGFFYTKYPIYLIGFLIAFIPETKKSINSYKETNKISFYLISQIIVFITTIFIIITTILGI